MIPKSETPLIRVERDIAWLKSLPTIMVSVVRPRGILRLGPWSALDEPAKHSVLERLDWSGVAMADYQRIMEREVKPYIFNPFCRSSDAD